MGSGYSVTCIGFALTANLLAVLHLNVLAKINVKLSLSLKN